MPLQQARGIILTNRHVVTPGPIVAEAIFHNREELPVLPVFFDPVHDFAFFRCQGWGGRRLPAHACTQQKQVCMQVHACQESACACRR